MNVSDPYLAELMAFLRASPSPYHAVANAAVLLERAGFRYVDRRESWADPTGLAYTSNGGALIAWSVPPELPATAPWRMVGAHTDSPNLRL